MLCADHSPESQAACKINEEECNQLQTASRLRQVPNDGISSVQFDPWTHNNSEIPILINYKTLTGCWISTALQESHYKGSSLNEISQLSYWFASGTLQLCAKQGVIWFGNQRNNVLFFFFLFFSPLSVENVGVLSFPFALSLMSKRQLKNRNQVWLKSEGFINKAELSSAVWEQSGTARIANAPNWILLIFTRQKARIKSLHQMN